MINLNVGLVNFNLGMSFNSAKGLSFNVADLSGFSVIYGLESDIRQKTLLKKTENKKRDKR